jgi:hypothetical protein
MQNVMIAFFGAFAGFSAFGTVIATFLVSSDALSGIGARWGAEGINKAIRRHPAGPERNKALRWARNRRVTLLWSTGGVVILAALVSALGLVFSYLWLHHHTSGSTDGWGWAYRWTGRLLVTEVILITLITLLAMLIAVWFAVKGGTKTEEAIGKTGSVTQGGSRCVR